MVCTCQISHVWKSQGTKNRSSTSKLLSNKISRPKIKNHTSDEKKKLAWQHRTMSSKSDCCIWILVCSFCCSHILHILHVLLCRLIDEGTLLEYTVNQQGFTFGETIDEGSLSERQGVTFGETIDQQWGHFWKDSAIPARYFWQCYCFLLIIAAGHLTLYMSCTYFFHV